MTEKKTVGRPAKSLEEATEIRRQIIEAAKSLFAEEGFDNVSMRKIAVRAGCSARRPYLYFSGKQQIVRYVWEDFFVELFDLCEEAVSAEASPIGRLRAFAQCYGNYWFSHPERFELVYMVKDQVTDSDDVLYVDGSSAVGRYVIAEDLIASCMQSGEFREGDPQFASQLLFANIHGILSLLINVSEFKWAPFDDLLRSSIEMFIFSHTHQSQH
ncbi:TetR/AcrR family transcriptional regulator [uncultured Algimonas sp.]|uniref:TetR/AcrR family transcriptional regulator n=1 Tax=uncultured Algimonas sp. TaxID=1547920 RepID=UPI0026271B3B|nr:TetR/AcrR family transcriptional regulator [uncultured Algimonas sp.]